MEEAPITSGWVFYIGMVFGYLIGWLHVWILERLFQSSKPPPYIDPNTPQAVAERLQRFEEKRKAGHWPDRA